MLSNENAVTQTLRALDEAYDGQYMLVHQAAVSIMGLDRNLFLNVVDVCVPFVSETVDTPVFVRLHTSLNGKTYEELLEDCLYFEDYKVKTASPVDVLHGMPEGPEYRYLLEQQAFLAEVLYVDELSDDALKLFHKYLYDM